MVSASQLGSWILRASWVCLQKALGQLTRNRSVAQKGGTVHILVVVASRLEIILMMLSVNIKLGCRSEEAPFQLGWQGARNPAGLAEGPTFAAACSISDLLLIFGGVALDLARRLLVLLTDFVELLHVIEKLCTALESDE